jgi:hypothetical protein
MVVLLIILSNLQTKQTIKMAFRIENITHFQNMMIENVQNMEEELFYKQHDEQFDEMEQHIKEKTACGWQKRGISKSVGGGRYKKLKCSHSQQIQYAQKIAVKRLNAKLKKIDNVYARNRINLRQAVQQEFREPEVV